MELSFSARVTIPEGVVIRDVAGESVILNLNNEQYYGLDDIGTRMWVVLTSSPSIQDAVNALLEEFDVSKQTLEQDVRTLLAELSAQELLEFHED